MTTADALQQGRDAFARRAWADAHARLADADRAAPLGPEDLERLAVAAYLAGRDAESADAWARAHHELLRRGEVERAVRCAFWLAFELLNAGEVARGGGWLSRGRRLLDECGRECVEQGYLLLPEALRRIAEGDLEGSIALAARAAEIGTRFHDPDLVALARHGQGRALIRVGRTREGVALLDEAMAAVEAGEVSAMVAGDVYCSVISGCLEIFDLGRAHEWTAALAHWCESQPDLVPYRGPCLVRRAEILQLRGAWPDALRESRAAREHLARASDRSALGVACYRQAELHRVRGEYAEAEEAYREAVQLGCSPEPGLALLRLAQRRVDDALAAIRRVTDEAHEPRIRCRLLPALVEIALAAGDAERARAAADELSRLASELDAPYLHGVAAHAHGAVLLAAGDARSALPALRRAWTIWQELDAPYEGARVRVLLGLACRELADADTAALELEAARAAFQRLGATPDAARVRALTRAAAPSAAGRLTARELQVLRLVAAGRTNRAIAVELLISEKTVARHVSNIFTKLGLSSRSAATAYAFRHGIAQPTSA